MGSLSISFGAQQGFSIISRNILGLSQLCLPFAVWRGDRHTLPDQPPQVIAPSKSILDGQPTASAG
jgi:hypothetical protein